MQARLERKPVLDIIAIFGASPQPPWALLETHGLRQPTYSSTTAAVLGHLAGSPGARFEPHENPANGQK